MKSFMDCTRLVAPRKIRKMLFMNLIQKRIPQIKASQMLSSWRPMKRLANSGATLVGRQVGENACL